ncbi:hypothetical protein DFH06DRAFT_1333882 [Mycena polygramma]|nr:hypothetical protein DFH06DRAFT_1333882 [Mycena polygramma]
MPDFCDGSGTQPYPEYFGPPSNILSTQSPITPTSSFLSASTGSPAVSTASPPRAEEPMPPMPVGQYAVGKSDSTSALAPMQYKRFGADARGLGCGSCWRNSIPLNLPRHCDVDLVVNAIYRERRPPFRLCLLPPSSQSVRGDYSMGRNQLAVQIDLAVGTSWRRSSRSLADLRRSPVQEARQRCRASTTLTSGIWTVCSFEIVSTGMTRACPRFTLLDHIKVFSATATSTWCVAFAGETDPTSSGDSPPAPLRDIERPHQHPSVPADPAASLAMFASPQDGQSGLVLNNVHTAQHHNALRMGIWPSFADIVALGSLAGSSRRCIERRDATLKFPHPKYSTTSSPTDAPVPLRVQALAPLCHSVNQLQLGVMAVPVKISGLLKSCIVSSLALLGASVGAVHLAALYLLLRYYL